MGLVTKEDPLGPAANEGKGKPARSVGLNDFGSVEQASLRPQIHNHWTAFILDLGEGRCALTSRTAMRRCRAENVYQGPTQRIRNKLCARTCLLDHLIGPCKHQRRDHNSKRLCGPQIDDELEAR